MTHNDTRFFGYLPAISLICPFLIFLDQNQVSLFNLFVLISITVLLAVGMMISLVIKRMPLIIRVILLSIILVPLPDLLISVSFVRQTLLVWLLTTLIPLMLMRKFLIMPLFYFLTATSVISLISMMSHDKSVISFAENASIVRQDSSAELPPVVHVVFDEMSGLDYLRTTLRQSDAIDDLAAQVLDSNHFRVSSNVFSRSFNTVHSLSSMMNFNPELETYIRQFNNNKFRHEHNDIEQLAYFEFLSDLGYEISVIESGFLDFCDQGYAVNCITYQSAGLSGLSDLSLTIPSQLKVVLRQYLKSLKSASYVMERAAKQHLTQVDHQNPFVNFGNWEIYESPLISLNVFEYLIEHLREIDSGEMVFAHLLIPHFSYMLDEQCESKNTDFFRNTVPWDGVEKNSDSSRLFRYQEYARQYQCTLRLIGNMIEAVPEFDNTLFIIHGDHGSRIMLNEGVGLSNHDYPKQNLSDLYNTFFAVKYPTNHDAVPRRDLPLDQALVDVLANVFGDNVPQNWDSQDRTVYSQTDRLYPYPVWIE